MLPTRHELTLGEKLCLENGLTSYEASHSCKDLEIVEKSVILHGLE